MVNIQHKRGTRAAFNALVAGNSLQAGQMYVLTDEPRIAIALTANTYKFYLAENEAVSALDFPVTEPVAPGAGLTRLFGINAGGRSLMAQCRSDGQFTSFQPHKGRNKVATWIPAGNSTNITTDGATALTATGTLTSAAVGNGNRYDRQKRIEFLATSAATNAVAGFRYNSKQWTLGGDNAGDGGFHFICRFGLATGCEVTTKRCFVGMTTNSNAPVDVNPSSLTNLVGFGYDSEDTNFQFMCSGPSATNKTDTGIAIPTIDRSKSYEAALFSPPGANQEVYWTLTDMDSGGTIAEGSSNSNLPSLDKLLAPRGFASVGGTSSVVGLALMSLYIESDY